MFCCRKTIKSEINPTEIEIVFDENNKIDLQINEKVVYFYLVRHGETDYNKQGKIQGHLDIPLNGNGLNQAKALASSLTKHIKNPNAVIVSPVLRGKQTGEEIYKQLAGKEELKFAVMEEFAELHYGDLVDELLKDCEDFIIDLKESKWTTGENEASFPGDKGESFNSIISRMKKGFYKLGKEYENGSNIIIATHSQCIEAFLVYLKAFSYLDKGIRSNNKNCTLSKIQFNVNDETFQVKSVFDDLTVDVKKIVSVNVG